MMNFAQTGVLLSKVGVVFDPDFQAWLDRGTALGYTLPSDDQKIVLNDWVLGLKADSLWTKFDILYWFAIDGDSDMATLNFKDPSNFQVSKVSSPTFTTNIGFTMPTSNAYLDTTFNPTSDGVNYTQDDASIVGYFEDTSSGTIFVGTDTDLTISMRFASVTTQRLNSTNALSSAAGFVTDEYKGFTRTSSTNVQLYNGTTQTVRTQTSTAMPNVNVRIARYNGGNGLGVRCRWFGLGSSFTQTEHGTLRTLSSDLFTAL